MTSIEFLKNELPTSDGNEIDSVSPDFMAIVEEIDKGDFRSAAKLIEIQFKQNRYDIRLIGYYLYQHYLENGPATLPDLAETLLAARNVNRSRIGPSNKQDRYYNNTLAWLGTSICEDLTYKKKTDGTDWQKIYGELSPDIVQATTEKFSELTNSLSEATFKSSGEAISRLLSFLRELNRELSARPSTAPEESEADEEPLEHPEPVDSMSSIGRLSPTNLPGRMEIDVSPKFISLCEKLSAFEQVVKAADFRKAAMISNDIMSEIESFDPRENFPKLFSSFFGALTEHVNLITPYWDQKETLEWKMREQLYKVDLPSFIKSN